MAGFEITAASTVRETEPFGVVDQPSFLNQVISGLWAGTPLALVAAAKEAERRAGRTPTRRWGPRIADADVLIFGDQVVHEPGVEIPHRGLALRRFVLEPMVELAPDLVHPVLRRSMSELLRQILESET
jgi:2-amino-4-hydroxy-6-hydroxymethyldihydropteridine diphosphokinase